MAPSSPWYRRGLCFSCTRCGDCCTAEGHVWVNLEEMQALADHLGLPLAELARRYVRRVGERYSLIEKGSGECIFWSGDCEVYAARPAQCRTFPFWRGVVASPGGWARTAEACPGMNRGRRYGAEEIERLLAGQGETAGAEEPE